MGMHEDRAKLEDPKAAHSLFGASGSPAWVRCAGYLDANYGLPDNAGVDAAKGTVLHELTEESLNAGRLVEEALGTVRSAHAGGKTFTFTVDDEMMQLVHEVFSRIVDLPGDQMYEVRVVYDDLTPIRFQGGTCDFAAMSPGILRIRDYKYGAVPVYVTSEQPRLYAYGMFREWDWMYGFEQIEIGILQPRLGYYETQTYSRQELLDFADWIREKAFAAWEKDAPRTPHPKACQWCKAAVTCAARAALMHALADDMLDDETNSVTLTPTQLQQVGPNVESDTRREPQLEDPTSLTTAHLEKLFMWRSSMEKWFKGAHEELLRRHENGEPLAMHKMVESRTNARFKDDQRAVATLVSLGVPQHECYTDPSVITPAQAAVKIAKFGKPPAGKKKISREGAKKLLETAVVKPPGNKTLVPISDGREAIPDAATYLDDEDSL